ncbi:MAG: hypothetical protein ACMUHM_09620 [Thermoplasmatota archaeon]
MTSRCPKCGKNNYGDVQKCSFCGAPLVFIPGEEIPQISEEDIQAKLSTLKVERIRNPVLIGGGGIVAVFGLFLAIALFLIFMILVFSPSSIEPTSEAGSIHYAIPGGEEYIFGEITLRVEDGAAAETQSYGYKQGYYAYEMDGDGNDRRRDRNIELEPDVWFYSEDDIGDVGDTVLVKVKAEPNSFMETRAVSQGKAGWGGTGWFWSGWIFLLPGILMMIIGIALSVIGIIGKADRSMERLMEEDKEFRRQQLMLREAARKQMQAQHQQQQWTSYSGSLEDQPQPVPGAAELTPEQAQFAQMFPPQQPQMQPQAQSPQYAPPPQGYPQQAPQQAQGGGYGYAQQQPQQQMQAPQYTPPQQTGPPPQAPAAPYQGQPPAQPPQQPQQPQYAPPPQVPPQDQTQ